jgi:TRAP-type C4-dicarboxylate transport system permease small subunit
MAALMQFKKVVYKICEKFNLFGVLLMLVMIGLVVVDVLGRGLFDKPIDGSYELIEYTMVAVITFAMGYTQIRKGNTDVDTLIGFLPKKARAIWDRVINLCGFLTFSLIAWETFVKAGDEQVAGTASAVLLIEKYPFVYIASIGFILLALVFGLQFILPDE